jgi:Uma2 family endonuclease
LGKVEYNIEYQNEEIIATGYETNQHGNIIFEIISFLGKCFPDNHFQGFAENRPVYIKGCQRVYNPDVFVIDGPSKLFEYSPGLNAETNPFLIVEVLSKSTYDHDWENKLPCYKELPSIEHIVFIESRFPSITIFTKTPGGWDKAFYNEKQEAIAIRGQQVSLEKIYRKAGFFK